MAAICPGGYELKGMVVLEHTSCKVSEILNKIQHLYLRKSIV